ncbi:hypothetical protein [Saccharothrix lopnurensis]|uniref:NB-ARC domain-containing protein n=1 Tax=Saccharothrix lopnurensis TaxID=1670621 RepID=A0ABW1PC12_9PSEU
MDLFTGRTTDLAVPAAALRPDPAAAPVVISAVAGLAGVGKTTLAVRAAHEAVEEDWFPGGVLFIDLRGYDPPERAGRGRGGEPARQRGARGPPGRRPRGGRPGGGR